MQLLVCVLSFASFAICIYAQGTVRGSPHIPQGALSFSCVTARGKSVNIPVKDTKVPLQIACAATKSQGKKITEFPKRFTPGYGQKMSATSATGTYYINPVNQQLYPDAFIVVSDDCGLAGVMMSRSSRLSNSQNGAQLVGSRPANSVRTRTGSPVPQSVRTRPSSFGSQSAPNVANSGRSSSFRKRAVAGSGFLPCKMKTYSWNDEISGTGRSVGNIPVPGSRTPI